MNWRAPAASKWRRAAASSINGDCRTSDESIYAIGECAAYEGRVFGLVAPGYQMARIAAARMLGDRRAKSSPAPT